MYCKFDCNLKCWFKRIIETRSSLLPEYQGEGYFHKIHYYCYQLNTVRNWLAKLSVTSLPHRHPHPCPSVKVQSPGRWEKKCFLHYTNLSTNNIVAIYNTELVIFCLLSFLLTFSLITKSSSSKCYLDYNFFK